MAKKKVVKTLLIGLGGTGNLALKYAKKRFHEMYGDQNNYADFDLPLVEYLALDTFEEDLIKGVGSDGLEFGLKASEYQVLHEKKPKNILKKNPFIQKEWFPKMSSFTALEEGSGAGQIRSLGRLSLMSNYEKIKQKVTKKVQNLTNWEQGQDSDYDAMGSEINVVFCFSVAGGTGSGTFLDVAYVVKSALEDSQVEYKSQAYIVMPEIFDKIISNPLGKRRIYSNTYAALRELEFFMSGKYNKDFELLSNGKITIPVDGAPFGLVHLVSSQNSEGDNFDEITHIMELIGNSIVLKSGAFESDAIGGWSQIGGEIAQFDYLDDAKTQFPRYLGLGYAEIKYDTALLANFASAKYSAALADFIIDSNNRESEISLEQKILNWGIKEDEADELIDQLLPLKSYTSFVLDEDGYDGSNTRSPLELNAEAHVSNQIQQLKQKSEANLLDMQNRIVKNILDDFTKIEGSILDKGGVTTAIDAIDKLLSEPFIKRYAFQMNDEIENNYSASGKGINEYIANFEKRIKVDLAELSKAQDSMIFGRRAKCIRIIDQLVSSYNELLKYNLHKIRREDAKRFYANLSEELDLLKNKLSNFKTMMTVCKQDFHTSSQEIRSSMNEGLKPFVKNLASSDLKRLGLDVSSIKLSLFLSMSGSNLFSFIAKDQAEIQNAIENYIVESSIIKSVKKETLTTYLDKTDKNVVVNHLSELRNMAQPLFQIDKSGFALSMGDNYQEQELWGIAEKKGVYALIEDVDANATSLETKDHSFLMLSTMHYPAPISALTNLQKYYDDYHSKRAPISFDTDIRIREAMDQAGFELLPKDDTEQKTIFAWIFGLILCKLTDKADGMYRRGTGKFFIKTEQASPLNDNWLDLDTAWRDDAFVTFNEKGFEVEILRKVKSYLDSIGGDAVKKLIEEIKDRDTYINKYSNLNRSLSDLINSKDSRDKEVQKLLTIELNFIKELSLESMNDYL